MVGLFNLRSLIGLANWSSWLKRSAKCTEPHEVSMCCHLAPTSSAQEVLARNVRYTRITAGFYPRGLWFNASAVHSGTKIDINRTCCWKGDGPYLNTVGPRFESWGVHSFSWLKVFVVLLRIIRRLGYNRFIPIYYFFNSNSWGWSEIWSTRHCGLQ
jgi:hypothetical protein